jgi:hypothetical protein
MTDRELLEFAAKAAGIGPLDFDYAEREGHGFYFGPRLPMPQGVLMAAKHTYWNPLEDGGNALSLAVMLSQTCRLASFEITITNGSACAGFRHPDIGPEWGYDADPFAATCRAIVLAAAEIGKGMP